MIGIYCIVNLLNNKKYFGQSTNVENRIKDHKYALDGDYHHNNHLQKAYTKYGEINFMFCPILECEEDALDFYEIKFISEFEAMNPKRGYNLDSGGNLNKHYSKEALIKRSGENHPKWGTSACENFGGVSFIKSEINKCKSKKEIAKNIGIAPSSLDYYLNVRGYNWVDLGGTPLGKRLKGSLYDDLGGIPFIKSEIRKGKSQRQISRDTRTSHSTIRSYIKRRGYNWNDLRAEALSEQED